MTFHTNLGLKWKTEFRKACYCRNISINLRKKSIFLYKICVLFPRRIFPKHFRLENDLLSAQYCIFKNCLNLVSTPTFNNSRMLSSYSTVYSRDTVHCTLKFLQANIDPRTTFFPKSFNPLTTRWSTLSQMSGVFPR